MNRQQKLNDIIQQYVRFKRRNPDEWIQHSKKQKHLRDAIQGAALSINGQGEKHPHQYRLQKKNMQAFANNLINLERDIQNIQDFDGLIKIVESAAPNGIGELMIYDTAVRIGAFLGLSPSKVYLHAGTRKGLNKLVKNFKGDTIEKNQLPKPFKNSNLNCFELEDLLCIYKDQF